MVLRKLRLLIIAGLVALGFVFFNQIAYAATFVLTDANIFPQSLQAFRVVATDDEALIGNGSWQATGIISDVTFQGSTAKAGIDVFPGQYGLPASFTLDDIDSIDWSTFQTTYGNPNPVDFYVTIYLSVPGQGFSYGRLTGEGIYAYNRSLTDGAWNTWTTAGATNEIAFYQASDPANTFFGFFNGPTLADLQAGPINFSTDYPTSSGDDVSFDYGAQQVNFIRFETASSWGVGFTGYIDQIRVVVSGTEAILDLEPSNNEIVVGKQFVPGTVAFNDVATVSFTVSNPTSDDLTDITIEDGFPDLVSIIDASNAGNTCGGAFTFDTVTNNSFTLSGFDLDAGESCTFSVDVTAGMTAGIAVNNQENLIELSADGSAALDVPDFEASLTIIDDTSTDVTFGKLFSNSAPNIGAPFAMTLFVFNGTASPVVDAGFTDQLADPGLQPVGLPILAPSCDDGADNEAAVFVGTNLLTVSNIDVPANGAGICELTVPVICTQAGTIDNVTSALDDGGLTIAPAASDSITCVDPNAPTDTGGDDDDDDGDDDEEETPVDTTAAVVTDPIADTPSSQGLLIDIEAEPNVISGTGANVTWTVTVTNATDSAFDPGQLVTEIDSQFGLLSATGSQGSSEISGNQVLTQTGVIDPSTPLVLVIESVYNGASAAVPEGAAAQIDGDLCGTGTISGQSDTDCVTILPPELPDTGGDAPPQSIPAWLLLAGLIGLLGGGLAWKVAARKA